jgi:hypothetical protein
MSHSQTPKEKLKMRIAVIALLVLVTTLPLIAQTADPVVDQARALKRVS